MKNRQDYYYNIFWRSLLVIYIYAYAFSAYGYFDLLYNKNISSFTKISDNIMWYIPNILNHINGDNAKYIWGSIFFISIFLVFRKTYFVASIILWYIFVCFGLINPLTTNVGSQTLLMLLIISASVSIPFKKTDIDNKKNKNIYTKPFIFLALWINFAMYYFYSGYTKMISYAWSSGDALVLIGNHQLFRPGLMHDVYNMIPAYFKKLLSYFVILDELAVPLAFLSRNWMEKIWYSVFALQIGLLIFMNLTDIQILMLIYSLVVFDPAWIRGRENVKKIIVYYDGYCGLCHNFVKHIINLDNQNKVYFKNIQETHFMSDENYVKNGKIKSILVSDGDEVLSKTRAVLYIYDACGGIFKLLSFFIKLIPLKITDKVYDLVASNRYKVFGKKDFTCPVVSEELVYKFES